MCTCLSFCVCGGCGVCLCVFLFCLFIYKFITEMNMEICVSNLNLIFRKHPPGQTVFVYVFVDKIVGCRHRQSIFSFLILFHFEDMIAKRFLTSKQISFNFAWDCVVLRVLICGCFCVLLWFLINEQFNLLFFEWIHAKKMSYWMSHFVSVWLALIHVHFVYISLTKCKRNIYYIHIHTAYTLANTNVRT